MNYLFFNKLANTIRIKKARSRRHVVDYIQKHHVPQADVQRLREAYNQNQILNFYNV